MRRYAAALTALLGLCIASDAPEPWYSKYGYAEDRGFVGVPTFAHLPHRQCLNDKSASFDIAFLGAPFDGLVSYRTGTRFGPRGLRIGSQRLGAFSINLFDGRAPFQSGYEVIDCGDIPLSPFEPLKAIDQIEVAYDTLLALRKSSDATPSRILLGGGDHSITLPVLRSLKKHYGPLHVIHFDSHLDTYRFRAGTVTHGSMFVFAFDEGLLADSIHLGIRGRGLSPDDLEEDRKVGFTHIMTDDIDGIGIAGIVNRTKKRAGDGPVYISFDVDVLDPAFVPATGTVEPGGWTTREVKQIIRGLRGLNVVGADIVELAPPYDTQAEVSQITASDIAFELMGVLTERRVEAGNFRVQGEL